MRRDVERIGLTVRGRRAGAGSGGQAIGGDLADTDVTQSGRQNAAPKKASRGTGPATTGAFDAMKAAIRAARWRTVPPSPGAIPKSTSAHWVQRRSDAQRVAEEAPTVLAVLVRARTDADVSCAYAQSASAHAIAPSEYRYPRAIPRGTTTSTALHARQV
jgi:hypothetical protein